MWGKIIIPMYRLWLNGLYGLYGPRCPLFSKRPINLISLSLSLSLSHGRGFLHVSNVFLFYLDGVVDILCQNKKINLLHTSSNAFFLKLTLVLNKISLNFVPEWQLIINVLVQIMVWHLTCDKPLLEPSVTVTLFMVHNVYTSPGPTNMDK